MSKILPRHPIYVPSKGRSDGALSAAMFSKDGVPFHLVVEPQEVEAYSEKWEEHLLVLPKNDQGLVYARNWIKDHSIECGAARHWQFDDDVYELLRLHEGYKNYVDAGVALAACEDFVDRYENVALASLNSEFFVLCSQGTTRRQWPPFYLNQRCYTNFLVMNRLPNRWRFRYNEDTDMTLQVLADGWCTILFNAFLIRTPSTEVRRGGQMASKTSAYQDDGRLKMARDLERVWPGVVTTERRFGRPQHKVADEWRRFDTPLKPSSNSPAPRDYGLQLRMLGTSKRTSLVITKDSSLRVLRRKKGLTKEQLAEKAGLSVTTVARLERHGMRRGATLVTLDKLATALDVALEELSHLESAHSRKRRKESE